MSIEATLEIEKTKLHWLETTRCSSSLWNGSNAPINHVNLANTRATPWLLVKNLESGEINEWSMPVPPEIVPPSATLASGEVLKDEFFLHQRLNIYGTGIFEIKARYTFGASTVDSPAIRLEVLSTSPRALTIASLRGGPALLSYCAWIDAERDKGVLWVTALSLSGQPRFEESIRLAELPLTSKPVLSIPPNTIPNRQWVGWIDGDEFHYTAHDTDEIARGSIKLVATGYKLVAPLFEEPFCAGKPQEAQALLIKSIDSGWEMQAAHLGHNPALLSEPINVKGAPPLWARSAYRSDLQRRTFFLVADHLEGGLPRVHLTMSRWGFNEVPGLPTRVSSWTGRLLASDLCLTGDDSIVGAAVLCREDTDGPTYLIQRWRLGADDSFVEEQSQPLVWSGTEGFLERAILRINTQGDPFLLLQRRDGIWIYAGGDGQVKHISPDLEFMKVPLDVCFADHNVPIVVHPEAHVGLKIDHLLPEKHSTTSGPPVVRPILEEA